MIKVTINNAAESLRQGFWEAKQSGKFTDVTLIAEGKAIKVHRIVLEMVSEVFKELLKGPKDEHILNFNMKPHTLTALVNFIYLGKLSIDQLHAADLLKELTALKIEFNQQEVESKLKEFMKQPVKAPKRRHTTHNKPSLHACEYRRNSVILEFLAESKTEKESAANEDLAMIDGVAANKAFPCSNYANCKRVLKSKGGRTQHERFCKVAVPLRGRSKSTLY